MAFSFLHTGDWHIAKPFGRFEPEIASLLRAARLGIIERLAAVARRDGVGHILVAGDIYDHSEITNKALMEPLERMKSAGDIAWHLISGNHDPGEPGGIWERVVARGLPANVFVHLDARPVELGTQAVLLPSPVLSRRQGRDSTMWMDEASTGEGRIRIGLAHGATAAFGSDDDQAIIDPRRAESAGLAYLALGDWHGVKQVGARTWYAGTPEPDQFPDNEPGFALLVRAQGTAGGLEVERRETARYTWLKRALDVRSAYEVEQLEREIESMGPRAHDMLLQLRLAGDISLAMDDAIARCLDRLEARLFHLVRRTEDLRLLPEAGELASLKDQGLHAVAERIALRLDVGGSTERAVAERALRRFFGFARVAEGEAK